jgi:hypothetical protein
MFKRFVAACTLALASLAPTSLAHAQSTAFTYQGRLTNAGQPAAGTHDFRFRLFDAASAGAQIGTTQCVDNLQVAEGVFTATIDFGNQFATPAQRFIEIEVRRDTGLTCASAVGFVVLASRQLLSATPMAAHAKSAFALDAPDGSPANAVFVDNDGKVGIGTLAPTHSVHIATPAPTMALQDTDSTGTAGGQQVGYISYRDSTNVERGWLGYGTPGSPHFSIVNARSGGNIALLPFSGNVGIGTDSPTTKLEVRGDVKVGASGQYFAAAGEENLRIVRGTVGSGGGSIEGTGYTVTRTSTGTFSVTFNTPFADRPSIVASSVAFRLAGIDAASASGFVVNVSHNGTSENFGFDFVAVGPR